jgi:hypothetical protein
MNWTVIPELTKTLGTVVTAAAACVGAYVALRGLRTFERWRHEKIEENRIAVAVEALSVAYKSKFVFEFIRSPLTRSYEYKEMAEIAGESEDEKTRRGSFYAALHRIEQNREYFEHVWELQPKFMAVFGKETEEIFLLLHTARKDIEVACEMLMYHFKEPDMAKDDERKLWVDLRRAIWSSNGANAKEADPVGTKLEQFRTRIEALCRPVLEKNLVDEKSRNHRFFRNWYKILWNSRSAR